MQRVRCVSDGSCHQAQLSKLLTFGGMDVKRAQASSPPPRHPSWATLCSTRPTPSPSHLAKIFITGFFFGHLSIPPEKYWLSTLARSSAFGLPLQPTLLTRALRRTEMDPNEHTASIRSGTSTSRTTTLRSWHFLYLETSPPHPPYKHPVRT